MTSEQIARVCHETNRAYCAALGDHSQLLWECAPAWQRESMIAGVEAWRSGTRSGEGLHDSWCEAKRADGWTYGPVKDPVAKTHPCLVPYAELPAEQRRKDALSGAICFILTQSGDE